MNLWGFPWQSPNCFPKSLYLLQKLAPWAVLLKPTVPGCFPMAVSAFFLVTFQHAAVTGQRVHPYFCSERGVQDSGKMSLLVPLVLSATSESLSEDVWRALDLFFLKC